MRKSEEGKEEERKRRRGGREKKEEEFTQARLQAEEKFQRQLASVEGKAASAFRGMSGIDAGVGDGSNLTGKDLAD